ncbi:MAG: domain nuclease [Gemmatimonadetes bacterium]|nr:domain nuclease [Gemmatimonadota bacterium]
MMQAQSVWAPAELARYEGALLLDTHIWIWHLEGNTSHMAPAVTQLLDRAGARSGLHICDISAWEVAVKARKGKLQFSIDPMIWLRRAERAPGTRSLALDREILLASTMLPGNVHNDPADRMLLAAAKLNNLPLVTADALIVEYAMANRGTPVIDARPGARPQRRR